MRSTPKQGFSTAATEVDTVRQQGWWRHHIRSRRRHHLDPLEFEWWKKPGGASVHVRHIRRVDESLPAEFGSVIVPSVEQIHCRECW